MSESGIDKKDLIDIRDAIEDDLSFIFSTWLKGLRYGNDWFELIESSAYYENYHKTIQKILASDSTTVKIACLKESPGVILGYSVYRNSILDYVFVKKAWRKIGIAKSLVPEKITTVTQMTNTGRQLLNKYPGTVFNPFL